MALVLKFTACLEDECSKLLITDTTDIYHATNNPTGWGSPNLTRANVSSATILIEFIDEDGVTSTVSTTDVLSQIPNPVTDTFEFNLISGTYPDGYYKITYTVVSNTGDIYRTVLRTFFYCNVQCCIDKLIATIPDKICECTVEELVNETYLAEILLSGLKASSGCGNVATAYKLLERIEKICNFSDCECR